MSGLGVESGFRDDSGCFPARRDGGRRSGKSVVRFGVASSVIRLLSGTRAANPRAARRPYEVITSEARTRLVGEW